MTPDKELIRRRFDQGALHYHKATPVQQALAEELLAALPEDFAPTRILEVGCGTGHVTRLLCEKYPEAQILATDLSESMLEVASRVLALESNVTYEAADVELLADHLAEPYPDLIIGSAVLQWLEHPRLTVRKLARKVAPGGCVAFATFGPGSLIELQRALEPFGVEHPMARLPRAHDWQASLVEFDAEVYSDEVMQWAHDARSFLKDLSLMGAALPHAGMSPGNLRRMMDRYDSFADHRGLPVTWERIVMVVRPE